MGKEEADRMVIWLYEKPYQIISFVGMLMGFIYCWAAGKIPPKGDKFITFNNLKRQSYKLTTVEKLKPKKEKTE